MQQLEQSDNGRLLLQLVIWDSFKPHSMFCAVPHQSFGLQVVKTLSQHSDVKIWKPELY